METALFYTLIIYFSLLVGLALFMSGKMESEEDFLVGGRKFNLWLTTFCLFATWFGAGTLIAATDEVAAEGLKVTALEPLGAGMCLILAGIFFAKPLWDMQLMTYADFFRQRFGKRLEFLSVMLNIPIYVGWIAVQIVSLANILGVFFPVPVWVFMIGITLFACFLTISGGMWSVSITDSFQLMIIIIGLIYLLIKISGMVPEGIAGLLAQVEDDKLVLIPHERMGDLFNWIGVFSISALGNMTGQDLGQRMFSAKSAKVAKLGCLIAGVGYIAIGSIPVILGLTASQTLGEFEGSVIPNLIKTYLDPVTAVILTLTIISAVVSTITSALLAPSSMLSHNYLKHKFPDVGLLKLCKYGVIVVAVISLVTAFAGEDVYGLLEASYAIGFVGFFVPVTVGLYSKKWDEKAILISVVVSLIIWLPEMFGYENLPYSLIAVLLGYPVYFISFKYLNQKQV
ncbi:MAG: sodium:solute symporter [Halobacteriovoraceae bacterium]|nr:sodium:solute symporter [Halobacteriovoraceae bacterium]